MINRKQLLNRRTQEERKWEKKEKKKVWRRWKKERNIEIEKEIVVFVFVCGNLKCNEACFVLTEERQTFPNCVYWRQTKEDN